jgi:hypothetical protein
LEDAKKDEVTKIYNALNTKLFDNFFSAIKIPLSKTIEYFITFAAIVVNQTSLLEFIKNQLSHMMKKMVAKGNKVPELKYSDIVDLIYGGDDVRANIQQKLWVGFTVFLNLIGEK